MNTRMQIPAKPKTAAHLSSEPFGILRRKCACGGSGGSTGECAECGKKKLQRSAAGAGPGTVPPIVHDVLRSSGQPLDPSTRSFFEPRFGHDFARIRVHTDAQAAASAGAVNALAYTVGRHIVLAEGGYAPSTERGRSLLAHELTHVVQQGQGEQGADTVSRIGSPSDAAEREADSIGRASLEGPIAPVESGPRGSLRKLGANPGCTKAESDAIHQAIFDARGWLNKAIPALEKSPLEGKTLASLKSNFGPTFGVAANAKLIHDRLALSRSALGTIPYSCAKAPADATCAAGNCGYTTGAGSHASTICTDVTLTAGATFKAGCVLHESFHATFAKMGVDFYSGWHGQSSSTAGFPGAGTDPLLNADSYTTLVMDLS